MLKLTQFKNTRIITFVLLFLTLGLAALAVITAVNLQKKDNVNPTPSSAASCTARSCVTQENNVAKCLAGDFGEAEKAKCESGDEGQSQYLFDRNECNEARQCEAGGAPGGACGVYTGSYPNGSCEPKAANLKAEGELCSAGSECATGICREATQCTQSPKTCGGQTPSNPALCTPVNATQAPNTTATPAPTGSGGLADCNGSTTAILRYGVDNANDARVRIINCQNNSITETYTEYQCKCDSKDGSGAAGDGNGRACGSCTPTTRTVAIPARTNQEVSTTCNPGSCGSCQADLSFPNAGGSPNPITDGVFKTSGINCGTGTGNSSTPTPTRRPNATLTPTRTATPVPNQTNTPTPTLASGVTPTPTPVADISVIKSANPNTVSPSTLVTYNAEFKNTTASPITLVKIVDDFADSFAYQTGTVTFTKPNGATFSREPLVSDGKLTWDLNAGEQVTLAQNESLKISYRMTSSSEVGTYPNTICLETPLQRCADANVIVQTQPNTGFKDKYLILSGVALSVFGGTSFVILKKRRYLNF
jgi:hypothetical protein